MIGTLVNVGAIIAGSLIGSIFKKGLNEKYQAALFTAIGFAATVLGINAVVTNMKNSAFPVLFIISLAIGSLIGTALDIDGRFQKLVGRFSTSNLGQGLSTGILLFCIGTLSILGPIESAIRGDHTYLFMNATLDLVTSMVLASTYGIGIILTAVVLFLWQGAIYMSADYLAPFLTADLLTEVSIVGGVLIASSGLSILKIKESKTLNMLPSLLVPIVWFLIKGWIG
ncbi:DUF554 domain-containing protein [Paenibacillus macerans]|uniref:DUF554 domain-containing protein n=1 Tax=Paenibacillus macerans TaxID=44252 RepID=UPI002040F020|nr:DUF554 domain-containing protein [Paenibacillus macerans]MCM3702822.1 DUF554 domain-containing protein [Paenibacillus macerans]